MVLIVCILAFSHPERPERVASIMEHLEQQDLLSLVTRVQVWSFI